MKKLSLIINIIFIFFLSAKNIIFLVLSLHSIGAIFVEQISPSTDLSQTIWEFFSAMSTLF